MEGPQDRPGHQSLPPKAAAYVDTHIAHVVRRCSFAQLERTVGKALVKFDPVEADKRRRDDAITAGAQRLADLGCAESLDVRRSLAAGAIARGEQTLDLTATDRDLTIYVHLDDQHLATVENTRSAISVEQVQGWCTRAGTTVTVRPVIDLNDNLDTDSYAPTPRIREQAVLTNPECVFPRCTRPSRRLDLDHIQAFDDAGATTNQNLASRQYIPADVQPCL